MTNRLKGILYNIVLFFARLGFRSKSASRKLLIVKTDEIGDYILWRQFLPEILNAERFKDFEIHFCGNKSWESLFMLFDNKQIKKIFWLEKVRFKKKMDYRYSFLRAIYKEGYDVVINPNYSRAKRIDDAIVMAAKASVNIGMKGNAESILSYERGYDKRLYNALFDYHERPVFEFIRNRLFTEFVTGAPSRQINTLVDAEVLPAVKEDLPNNYFVVFPGSRSAVRIWPIENFIAVSDYLYNTYGWTAVVCGAPGDMPYTQSFISNYQHPFLDLTAKTSLPQMLTVLKKAKCLLSVDTGSLHLAATVNCPSFGIFNGSQYGRFAPYPKDISSTSFAIYPDKVEKEVKDPVILRNEYEYVINIPYKDVSIQKVIDTIKSNLK